MWQSSTIKVLVHLAVEAPGLDTVASTGVNVDFRDDSPP